MTNTPLIQSQRLSIRPITVDDAHDLFKYRADAETNKFQGWIPKIIDDVVVFISKTATAINQPNSWFQLAIINKDTQELIGDIGLHFLGDENKQVEIGCTLSKNQHGKGYATEALKSIISYLFFELNKHRISTSIDPGNTSSIALVERLGFRKEAHFRSSLFINGQWVDDVVYALLNDEWQ